VHRAGDGLPQDLRLGDPHAQHVPHSRERPIRAVLGSAEAHVLHQPLDVEREESGGDDEDEEKDDVLDDQCPFLAS
jgi:hypothetical protein